MCDTLKPETTKWWTDEIKDFHEKIPFDGLWIDMNKPASFTTGYDEECDFTSELNSPPLVPNIKDRDHITQKMACLDSNQYYKEG